MAGDIVAGELVRLACQRHIDDLRVGQHRGLRFDADAANDAFVFFERFLRFYEGEHDGQPFVLQPSQCFILGALWGWKGPDGYRRFRTAYIEQGKGNGKSPMAAGIGILGLVADGEPGAEIYSAAAIKDQAKILFRDAEEMVRASPELSAMVESHVNNLSVPEMASFFRPVSSERRGLDGKRVHIALLDEVHEHPNSIVVDKMRAGTKGRRQALIFEITNSGYDRHSVCWQHHEYSEKVLRGIVANDSWFAYVCGLDKGDDWRDPSVWIKANPLLGVSITRKYLEEQVREAEGIPSKENIVKRLNFCIWTEQAERWMPMDKWDACAAPFTEDELLGHPCFGGLDLASTSDTASLCLLFPPYADRPLWAAIWRVWVPRDTLRKRSQAGVPYHQWAEQNYLTATDGNVIHYDRIRRDISGTYVLDEQVMHDADCLMDKFDIRAIAFDRWNATQLVKQLEGDGLLMAAFGQGFQMMSAPMKQVEKIVLGNEFTHGGNPVARWMASNVSASQDPAGNVKPDKEKSGDKIDGMVALVMAMGLGAMADLDSGAVGVRSVGA